jgi:lipopolysaccharide transport system permease protein
MTPVPGLVPPRQAERASVPTLVIEPTGRWPRIDLRELWAYRGLFFFLVWRDVKVRYAQTVLGAGWVIPFAPVLAGLVDFAVALVVLGAVMLFYGIVPGPLALVVVPLLLVGMMLTSAGVGCWLAALNIQYRDVKHVTPFLVQVWMYASPIVYPMSLVPERYRAVYALNPMAGIVEGFRAVLLGTGAVAWPTIGMSLAVGAVLFVTGSFYFRRTERVFADVA